MIIIEALAGAVAILLVFAAAWAMLRARD